MTAWGISQQQSQWYPLRDSDYRKDNNKDKCSKKYFNQLRDGEVDLLLDVDNKTLNICVVGKCDDKHEAKIWNLDDNENGWVPHLNCYSYNHSGHQFRIAKIPNDWYGKYVKEIIQTPAFERKEN